VSFERLELGLDGPADRLGCQRVADVLAVVGSAVDYVVGGVRCVGGGSEGGGVYGLAQVASKRVDVEPITGRDGGRDCRRLALRKK